MYLSFGMIQNFFKNEKKVKNNSHQIFPKLKFYYVIFMHGLQKCKNFQKIPKFWLFLTEIGQKLIYSPGLTRRDPVFLKLFFAKYFGTWVSYFLKLPEKSSFCVVDLTKFAKKNTTKSSLFCLKTPQFQLYCFSGIL